MIWIVIIIAIVAFVLYRKSNSDSSSTASKSSSTTYSSTVSSGRQLDKDNPYDVGYALGCLVAVSHGSNAMVDFRCLPESPNGRMLTLLDDVGNKSFLKVDTLRTAKDFEKLDVPRNIAQFLTTVPFEVRINDEFSNLHYKIPSNSVVEPGKMEEEWKKGFAIHPHSSMMKYEINNKNGYFDFEVKYK